MTIRFGQGVFGKAPFGGIPQPPAFRSATASTVTGFACQLAWDEGTKDIAFPVRLARGAEAIAQDLRQRLRTFTGEWFLDQRIGVNYRATVLIKNPSIPGIALLFRRVILGTPGIVKVGVISTDLNKADRILAVNFDAELDDGTVLTFDREPLIQ